MLLGVPLGALEPGGTFVDDDGSPHEPNIEALVVAEEFVGKRPIARHQLIYKSLGALVGNEIHALSIKALTPDEWREIQGEK